MTATPSPGGVPALPPVFDRYREIIPDPGAFAAALGRPFRRTCWTNTLRITPARLAAILAADDFAPEPLPWWPHAFRVTEDDARLGAHWGYAAGLYQIQEAASMLPALLLGAQPAERILDLCAAPGNKTAQMAVAMGNRGTVVANDLDFNRMQPLRATLDRLGLINVCTTQCNGMHYPLDAGSFDAVLVDAPCSCEGTSRKHPRVLTRPAGIPAGQPRRQQALLERAVQLCRPGGRIVYSTCTYAPEENECVVDRVLQVYAGRLRIVPATLPGLVATPGLTAWDGRDLHPDLCFTVRVWPHLSGSDGFYLAVLQKRGAPVGAADLPPSLTDAAFVAPPGWARSRSEDADGLTATLCDWFGLPPGALGGICLLEGARGQTYAATADLRPPRRPPPAVGLALVHHGARVPKLTTAGAALLGREARRHTLELDRRQTEDYLARRPVQPTREQRAGCPSPRGYVLVRHQGLALGVGFYREADGSLESLFPKARANVRNAAG